MFKVVFHGRDVRSDSRQTKQTAPFEPWNRNKMPCREAQDKEEIAEVAFAKCVH